MNYQKIYDKIIERAQLELEERKGARANGGYYEGHHIIPKTLGGNGKSSNWNHPNIVPLTAREHFICHWLLCRMYPDDRKLAHAFWFMSKQNAPTQKRDYVVSSRTYAEAVGNLKFTEEHKEKIRKTRVGKKTIIHPHTKLTKYVLQEDLQKWIDLGWENTNNRKGSKFTEEHKNKISIATKVRLTGKRGLKSQAAKGPYTVEFENGEKITKGSYPELVKATGIKYSTLQHRMVNKQNIMFKGWKIYKG